MIVKDVVNKSKKKKLNIKKIILFILPVVIVAGIYLWITRVKSIDVRYSLYDKTDIGFLGTTKDSPTKYHLINSYDEYSKMINTIDQWAEDIINTIQFPHFEIYDLDGMKEEQREKTVNNKNKEFREFFKEEYLDDTVEIIKECFEEGNYTAHFFEKNSLLLVEDFTYGVVVHKQEPKDLCVNGNVLTVHFDMDYAGSVAGGDAYLHFITVPKKQLENVNRIEIDINSTNTSDPGMAYKPIIYLYPEEDTNVEVKLGNKENVTVSYPKYIDGWNVLAKPDGTLKDLSTNRELYALYYENKNLISFDITNEGFVVKGEDTAEFLEEKLSLLGLTEREAEEFIIYWLPQLEANKYNYIRFSSNEEINKNMPLEITPMPDTVIRVLMTFKGLEKPIDVKEQMINTPTRNGFTVVEWGGTEIK